MEPDKDTWFKNKDISSCGAKQKTKTNRPHLQTNIVEMARAANSPVFGPSARGFETVRYKFF